MVPDYINDLNAMAQAESKLELGFDGSQWDDYEQALWNIVNPGIPFGPETLHDVSYLKNLISATAAQRAEALLRTIGKWENSQKACTRCGEPDPCACEPQQQGKVW